MNQPKNNLLKCIKASPLFFAFKFLFVYSLSLSSQINLNFGWYIHQTKIQLTENPLEATKSDSLTFENLKCYVSKIECLQDNKVVYEEANSFHLLDASNEKSLRIPLSCKQPFNAIRFTFGIDSVTNVSGAMGGDLDPINGMYWTWQSGYINSKIEGKSTFCKNPQKSFQFHLGGYAYPYKSDQQITLNTSNKAEQNIIIQMAEWYKQCQFQQLDHIMSPSTQAQKMSVIVSNCFQIAAP